MTTKYQHQLYLSGKTPKENETSCNRQKIDRIKIQINNKLQYILQNLKTNSYTWPRNIYNISKNNICISN